MSHKSTSYSLILFGLFLNTFLFSTLARGQACDPADLFLPAVTYSTMENPSSVFVDDINGDTFSDVLVVGFGSGQQARVRLGDAEGSLGVEVITQIAGASSIGLGDVTGDGLPDIVTASNGIIRIYPNLGSGDFGQFNSFQVLEGYQGQFGPVVLEDFDGDSHLDAVVVAPFGSGRVVFLKNDGFGNFGIGEQSQITNSYQFRLIKPADLDSDGDLDFVVTEGNGQIGYFSNTGTGSFFGPIQLMPAGVSSVRDIQLGDVNGDQKIDIVTGGQGSIAILTGKSDNTFSSPFGIGAGNVKNLAVNDMDGDGDLDISMLIQGSSGGVVIRFNDGQGGFVSCYQPYQGIVEVATGSAFKDLDNDQYPDLIVIDDFTEEMVVRLNSCEPNGCRADLSNDGYLDFFDISIFLQLFGSQNLMADFACDGSLDFFDVSEFLQTYSLGCP